MRNAMLIECSDWLLAFRRQLRFRGDFLFATIFRTFLGLTHPQIHCDRKQSGLEVESDHSSLTNANV
jgi:hypothetical protein